MGYYSLHVHCDKGSNTIFLDSISKVKDIVKRAKSIGLKGVSCTDHGTISAYVDYIKERDKLTPEDDFRIFFGIEGYLIDEKEYRNTKDFYHIILTAKDEIGFEQIKLLSSKSWQRSYMERGVRRIPMFYQDIEALEEKGHLVVQTACLGGYLPKAILRKDAAQANWFVSWLIDNFDLENVFLEIQPNDHSPEQVTVNRSILNISRQTGIPYIITTDSHYTSPFQQKVHEGFLNSREAKGFRETSPFYDYTYLMEESEIYTVMGNMGLSEEEIKIGLENTYKVANLIADFEFRKKTVIPQIKLPEFKVKGLFAPYYDKYPFLKDFALGEEPQNRYMIFSMEENIEKNDYVITDREADRLNTEMEVLKGISEYHQQPMSAYLNLVKRMIDIMWEVSPVMPGRGSCSGFLSCYYLGITQLNPLDYNLPWFRFLNLGRVDDFPDIDTDSSIKEEDKIIELLKKEFGDDCVLHTLTFKTSTLKSSILTAARGCGINNDEAQELSAMVPVKRGKMPTLAELETGNEDKDIPPTPVLLEALKHYDGLYEMVEAIEGVCTGIGIHASSLYIFSHGYLAQNALMRAPNGVEITSFDMHDSDMLSGLKMDLLKTAPPQLFKKCMSYMLKDGVIEWQGSLRATWDKYFHPKNVDYNDNEMWEACADGKVLQLFQFGDSQVGSNTIKKIRPHSLVEMALANDVMRLAGTYDGESPTDRFVRYKYNYDQAIKEMKDYGLNDREIALVEKHFGESYTVSCEQEQFMEFLLDSEITGFSLKRVNACRKILAKKQTEKIPEFRAEFFEKGKECGNREVFLEWSWKYLILPQLSYSFSRNHSVAYSSIGAIEAMLATKYNPLYWNAAVLSIQAGDNQDRDDLDLGDEEVVEDTLEEYEIQAINEGKKVIATTNYGKIAKAIGDIQARGIEVFLPHINKAEADFTPSVEDEGIIYGLQAIVGINSEVVSQIVANRPYTSLLDFCQRTPLTNLQMISLIKSGAFDAIEGKSRLYIMDQYLLYAAKQKIQPKAKLTMANYDKALELKIIPDSFTYEVKMTYFKKWIDKNCIQLGVDGKTKYYILTDSDELKFFDTLVINSLTRGKDYDIIPNGYSVKVNAFKKFYDGYIASLKNWMLTAEAIDAMYQGELNKQISEWKEKYCQGSISKWEMDSMSYYYSAHELAKITPSVYNVANFNTLPEQPKVVGYKKNARTGVEYPQYEMKRIMGTVLNADKTKHIVTLLTCYGVVDVKFYKMAFINYNKRITKVDDKGKKTVIEGSWFTRGNLLLINGLRKENMFSPRRDFSPGGFNTSVSLITGIKNNNILELKHQREKV